MGTVGISSLSETLNSSKMFSSSLSLVAFVVLLQVVPNYSTIATLALTTTAGSIITLTGAQVAGIAGLALLTKAAGLAAGVLVGRSLSTSSSSRSRSRGRREVGENMLVVDQTLEMLSEVEPEECYKRVLCAVETGGYKHDEFESILVLLRNQYERESLTRASSKFLEAARYGKITGEIAKCENRYQCSLDLQTIQSVF